MEQKYNITELQQAIDHLDQRAIGNIILQAEIERLRNLPKLNTRDPKNREKHAQVQVSVAHAMYMAGRITQSEFLYNVAMPLMNFVHDYRFLDGDYDDALKPISEQMEKIEQAHGLARDEYWPLGEGPDDYEELNGKYGDILDKKQGEVFREFGETNIADLWESNKDEFERLFERGRVAVFEKGNEEQGLRDLIEQYEREAEICGNSGSYYAACALIGAAMEARLLFSCITSPEIINQTLTNLPKNQKPNSNNPLKWNLNNLLEVCSVAGWLPKLSGELVTHVPEGWGHLVRELRNLLHPGLHIRKRPRVTIGFEEFNDAKAAYMLITSQLQA